MGAFLRVPDSARRRLLDQSGLQRPGSYWIWRANDVGDLHHKLRVLGGHRAFRNSDFRDTFSLPGPLANRDFPAGRNDDSVRCGDRRPLPANSYGTRVVLLLAGAVSERTLPTTGFSIAAGLGLIRDQHLFDDQRAVPLHRPDSGYRKRARTSDRLPPDALQRTVLRMARHRSAVAQLLYGLSAAGRFRNAAGPVGP